MKKKYLAWMVNGKEILPNIKAHDFIFKKLSDKFDKIYYINIFNLNFFKNSKSEKIIIKEKIPHNIIYYEPKSLIEFKNFLKDKELIAICNFGKDLEDLKKHLILNFLKIKFIQISNIGNIQWSYHGHDKQSFIKKFYFRAIKIYTQKFINLLSIIGLAPRIQIRFVSNLDNINAINKNKFKKLMYRLKLFYAKELIVVNSRAYDISKENKSDISEDFIVLLDYDLDHPDDLLSGAKYTKKIINDHYNQLNNLLENFSNKIKKKVVIAAHPRSNISVKKKYFPNYDVVQFKTLDYIRKAFIVIFFDSSAIIDAIILKKRAVTLCTSNLVRLARDGSNKYSSNIGIFQLNLDNIDYSKIDNIIHETEKRIYFYDKYINKHILPAGEESGTGYSKIINTIKERFF